MQETSAAAAEELVHRRIEFHAAATSRAVAVPVGFRLEKGLFTDAERRVAAARSGRHGGRFHIGESSGSGLDPEVGTGRIFPRKIGAGLHNLGNTCYLNSVLQCLTYTEPFVAYLQNGKHKSSCHIAGFCALCALEHHVQFALRSSGKILTPRLFVSNLKCISRNFRYYRQEDAHELMVSLLESMHKCCLPSGIPSESPSAYEKSLVHKIFGGRLKSQVRCTRCSHCSNKFDPFLDLSVEIGNATTLMKALYNFTEEELLDGGEKHYNCQQCKEKVVAKKRFLIDKAPYVLTIHLKRFSPFNPLQKIDKKVDFRTTLNLKPFVSNSEGMDLKYNLYGVLVHAGRNTQSGHYHCFIRTSSGLWHNLDDNQVCRVREEDVLKQKAYILFYVRERVRSSIIHKDNGAASLSEKERFSENIACMNGVIRNALVEKTLDFSLITKVDTKLQMQKPDKGQPSDISSVSRDQCSNEHINIEDVKASTSQNNAPVQKVPCTLPDGADAMSTKEEEITQGVQREIISPGQPEVCILDMKTQKLSPDNDQPSNISTTTSQDGSTEVTKDLTPQNNELVQKVRCTDPGGIAMLYSKPEQIILANQMETTSIGQPDACIPCDAHSDQNAYEMPLQDLQLESDGALVASGKDILNSALQLSNGVDGLLDANEQANELRTFAFCKPTPDSDATTIAQVLPTEVTAVSNGTISGNEDSTSNEAKGLAVKELYVKNIDDKVKAEEQTTIGNNTLGDGLAMVNEVSIMETDHMADAIGQNDSLDTGHVNFEKKFCSEDIAHVASSDNCAQVMCSENSALVVGKDPSHGNLHKNMKIKSKKHVKHSVVNLCFGSKQLLLASLKSRKKRKHKRTRRRFKSSAVTESIADDQQTSTSEIVLTSGISHKSHRRKRCRNSASSEDSVQMYGKKQNLGHSCAVELTMEKKGSENATLAGAELASLCSRPMSNPDLGKCEGRDEKGSWHFNLLTRGLRVPRWGDDDMANSTTTELQCSNSNSIGYVLDKWDEECDRGKRKKVRKSMQHFSGPNPFQEAENIRSRKRRRLQADQARSGHQPLRI